MKTESEPKRPRTKPAETRRAELMDAAQAVFLERTFDSASIEEIAARAGVAKGTFYLYFKTKDEALQALRERFVDRFLVRLQMAVAKQPLDAWVQRLDAWVGAAVEMYLDEFALHDLVFHDVRPAQRNMRTENIVTVNLAELVADGVKAGAFISGNPRRSAVMLFGAVHEAVDDEIAAATKNGRKRLIGDVRTFCRRSLGVATD